MQVIYFIASPSTSIACLGCQNSPRVTAFVRHVGHPSTPTSVRWQRTGHGPAGTRRFTSIRASAPGGRVSTGEGVTSTAGHPFARAATLAPAKTATQTAPPPPPPPPAPTSSSGSPLFFIGVGVALAVAVSQISSFLKKKAERLVVEQMMKSFSKGGGPPGVSFPGMGANPADIFAGFNMPPPSPPPPSASRGAPPVNTIATAIKGAPPPPTPSYTQAEFRSSPKEGEAEEVASSSTDQQRSRRKKRGAFQDVEVVPDTEPGYSWGGGSQSEGSSSSATGDFGFGGGMGGGALTIERLEMMLNDPRMRDIVLKFMPEGMRDPATLSGLLKMPFYRQQLQGALDELNANPDMASMLTNLDKDDTLKSQLEGMGMTQEEIMAKVMSDPEIMTAFQNPKVQKAIMDVASNPVNQSKYQNDPEVMAVFNKLTGLLFPNIPPPL